MTLSATYGPPTSTLGVKGNGFKGHEAIILTFDTTQVGKTTASTTGTFSITIVVPSTALPGNHLITGKGITSGLSARVTFLVQTDSIQDGCNRQRTHYNPFENVLNPGNVANLTSSWIYTTNTYTYSSPAVANGIMYFGGDDANLYALNANTGCRHVFPPFSPLSLLS